jgi:hypothetical protein
LTMEAVKAEGLNRSSPRERHHPPEESPFLDHLLAYREGKPVVPLLCYHDAFKGGSLHLSALYSKEQVMSFADRLGVTAKAVLNPELDGVTYKM